MAMKTCKECGNEISKSAKVCPHCGKKQKRGRGFAVLLIILGVILAAAGGISGGSSASSGSSAKSDTQEDVPPPEIGTAFVNGPVEITIEEVSLRDEVGTEFWSSTPSEGGRYVAILWKVKNISEEPLSGLWEMPDLKLISPSGSEYGVDIDASSSLATEKEIDSKVLSDLNPGITVKDADAFEVSVEQLERPGWKLLVDGKKDIEMPLTF